MTVEEAYDKLNDELYNQIDAGLHKSGVNRLAQAIYNLIDAKVDELRKELSERANCP